MFGFNSFSSAPISAFDFVKGLIPQIIIDTHDGDNKKKKLFDAEAEQKTRRKQQLISIYEDLIETKPYVVEKIIAPFVKKDNVNIYQKIDFDALLADLARVEALYREHQEMDDEEVLLLL